MAWTYDVTKLTDSTVIPLGTTLGARYQVRFLIQDTKTTSQLLQDEEVDWLLTQEANVYMAAAACCETLVTRAGVVRSKRISEYTITYDTEFYAKLATQLRSRGLAHQLPFLGTASNSDKTALSSDSDWVKPAFARGILENPGEPKVVTPMPRYRTP